MNMHEICQGKYSLSMFYIFKDFFNDFMKNYLYHFNCDPGIINHICVLQVFSGYLEAERSRLMSLWSRAVALRRQCHAVKIATDK